jgi:hypothetical protein
LQVIDARDNTMDHDEIECKARELGLSRLAAEYPDEFKRVLDNAKALGERRRPPIKHEEQ